MKTKIPKPSNAVEGRESKDEGQTVTLELPALPSLDKQAVTHIHLSNVVPSPFQPRKEFPEEEMQSLRESIRANGIRIPLLGRIKPKGKPGEIELVAGERRFRSAQALHKEGHTVATVPMIVQDLTDDEVIRIQRLENGARENLKALEAAEDYVLLEKQGKTVEEICTLYGVKRSHVFTRKRVAKLPDDIKKLIREGKLAITIADLIAKLPTKELQQVVTKKFTERKDWQGEITFREAAETIQDEYTVNLTAANWELDDPDLVKSVGPCSTCPKRSGNIPGAEGSPNICMDVKCFDLKRSTHSTKLLQEATAAGHRVIPSADYQRRTWDYVGSDEACHHDGDKDRQWSVLAKAAKIEPAVTVNSEGVAVKVFSREDQDKICKALKLGEHSAEGRKGAAEAEQREKQRDVDKAAMQQAKREVVHAALKDLDNEGKKALPLAFWQKLALMILHREHDQLCDINEEWLTGRGMKPTGDDDEDVAQLEDYIKRQVTPHNLIGFILWIQMDPVYSSDPGVLSAWGVNWEDFKAGKRKPAKPAQAKPSKPRRAKATKVAKAKTTKPTPTAKKKGKK